MAKSGVAVGDELVNAFNDQKQKKTVKAIIFCISKDKKNIEIAPESNGHANDEWADFCNALPGDDCRYATYDFPTEKHTQLIFVTWSPDSCSAMTKMLYSSSKGDFKKKLDGIACEVSGHELSDLAYEDVLDKVRRSKPDSS